MIFISKMNVEPVEPVEPQKPVEPKKPQKKKKKIRRVKAKIPRALREQVWLVNVGKQFERKCLIRWCNNKINVFDFHVGHNIPESKGGSLHINNLKPICARCNSSMSNNYSIEEWSRMGKKDSAKKPWWLFCC